MGKGIALEFKLRYEPMYLEYRKVCECHQLKPGMLHLWNKSDPWILNFPTKNHWRPKSKIEYIEAGLSKFAETYESKGITSIAFPELGTNQGGLAWKDVREKMFEFLEPLPSLEVEIYHYDPTAQDSEFDRFKQKVHRFDIHDYKDHLSLTKKQAWIIKDAVEKDYLRNMDDISKLKGFSKKSKSIKKILDFISSSTTRRMVTNKERRPTLDLDYE